MDFNFRNIVDEVVAKAKTQCDDLVSNTQKVISDNIPTKDELISKASGLFTSNKEDNKTSKEDDTQKKEIVVFRNDKKNLSDEEKSSTMLKILDWAYEKANSNIPGLGTSEEMAAEYLKKSKGNVKEAVDSLIRWQTTYAATTGFVSSFGGFTTIVVTLPANIAGVMAIQLRMIGAISHLAGDHVLTEERKTASYVCLLGAQAGGVLSKVASEFAIKMTTSMLKNLSGAALTKINQAVGFRLFTKFGTTGVVNLNKLIPIIGGVVGASIDAISTYAVAKAAKMMFLQNIIDLERQEIIEVERFKILVNMALADGVYEDEEKTYLQKLAANTHLSDQHQQEIMALVEHPKHTKVNISLFKDDILLSACLLQNLNNMIFADGEYSIAEKIYMKSLIKELGYKEEELKELLS